MAGSQEERLALNEALFRVANERMADWEERHSEAETELYHCECAELGCREKIRLTKVDYERVREDPAHFVAAPGHEKPDIETVIESHDDWVIVEKNPEVQALVETTDPRRD
jgi:hypothetical protein